MKKALSIVLLISGLMPICLGGFILAAHQQALAMLKINDTPEAFQAITLFGACLVPLGILQLVCCSWVWKNNWTGIILARWVGLMIIFSGTTLLAILHRPDLGVPDIAKGTLILILAMAAKK